MENNFNQEIWNLFSFKNESNPIYLDKYERFPISLKTHNAFDPIVSKYLYNLGFQPKMPNNHKFAVYLSHDIDKLLNDKIALSNLTVSTIKSLLKFDIKNIKLLKDKFLRSELKEASIEQLLAIHKPFNIKSTYFFLSLKENEQDFNYRIESASLGIKQIYKDANEIGLHGGHNCYNSFDKIKIERDCLNKQTLKEVLSYRGHYLKFSVPKTWELLEKLGFKYDSTIGYAECVGYRNGMCYPFKPYSLEQNKFLSIVEIPLVAMDQSLFNSKYMGLNVDTSFRIITKMIDDIAELGGVFSLLWHNTYLISDTHRKFYIKVLEYLIEKNAWFATGNEIVDLWEKNNYFEHSQNLLVNRN